MADIGDLVDALENVVRSRNEYAERAKHCEYDRSYFLAREIDNIETDERRFGELLDEYIQERIDRAFAGQLAASRQGS